MKNQKMRLIIGVVLGVVVLFYIGAMFGFFPFTICDDLPKTGKTENISK